MKPSRGRKPLRETIAANQAALAMYARAAGKPPIDLDVPPAPTKRDRAVSDRPRETPIKYAILKAVKKHPKVAWAGIFNRGVGIFGKQHVQFNTVKGLSDIGGQMKDGRALWLEAKRDADAPMAEDQMQFLNTVTVYRGVCGVVWSVEMALEILDRA